MLTKSILISLLTIFANWVLKNPPFSSLVKGQLHQTPYSNFTISFFNIFLLLFFYFLFFTTPKIPSHHIFFSLFFLSFFFLTTHVLLPFSLISSPARPPPPHFLFSQRCLFILFYYYYFFFILSLHLYCHSHHHQTVCCCCYFTSVSISRSPPATPICGPCAGWVSSASLALSLASLEATTIWVFFFNGFVIGLGSVPVDDLQAVGEVGKRRGLWVFVWDIEDLDLYRYFVFVVVVVVSVILGAGDSLQEREKKNVFYSENDEQ
jgi:hypothetical protein